LIKHPKKAIAANKQFALNEKSSLPSIIHYIGTFNKKFHYQSKIKELLISKIASSTPTQTKPENRHLFMQAV